MCLSVFPHDISKTDAARITKLDVEMFQDDSWKRIYYQGHESNKRIVGVGLCTLVSAGLL